MDSNRHELDFDNWNLGQGDPSFFQSLNIPSFDSYDSSKTLFGATDLKYQLIIDIKIRETMQYSKRLVHATMEELLLLLITSIFKDFMIFILQDELSWSKVQNTNGVLEFWKIPYDIDFNGRLYMVWTKSFGLNEILIMSLKIDESYHLDQKKFSSMRHISFISFNESKTKPFGSGLL